MGRRAVSGGEFARWRDGFRRDLADRWGVEFAAEAMDVLDADLDVAGEDLDRDRALLEATVPGTVLARRQGVGRG